MLVSNVETANVARVVAKDETQDTARTSHLVVAIGWAGARLPRIQPSWTLDS